MSSQIFNSCLGLTAFKKAGIFFLDESAKQLRLGNINSSSLSLKPVVSSEADRTL